MIDSLGGSEVMDPIAAMQEVAALFGGGSEDNEEVEDPSAKRLRQERVQDDTRFALEVATHEAAHAFWGLQLGMTIKDIGLYPSRVNFTSEPLDSLPTIRRRYVSILKRNVANNMKSWLGAIPPLEKLLELDDASFFTLLSALKPDYQYDPFSSYNPVCATPISRVVPFPDRGEHKAHAFGQQLTPVSKTLQMKRLLWRKDNPLHQAPEPLSLAIMAATVPVMGPFMGKTWAALCHLSPDVEPSSFSEWLCLEAPTDKHYLHAYQDSGKTRFFWHTAIHMAENCGGSGDYMNMLWSDQSRRAIGARINEVSPDTIMAAEALSGASFQDVVLAVFLSPIMYLHRRKAKIMYAVNGLARTLLDKRGGSMSGEEVYSVLDGFLKQYDHEAASAQQSLDFFMAKRWERLYNKHVDQHLSSILNNQFEDGSKIYFKAVAYFNDPKWTPVVAETTYNKFEHENWFTWTDQPFKQGRLTTTASPLL